MRLGRSIDPQIDPGREPESCGSITVVGAAPATAAEMAASPAMELKLEANKLFKAGEYPASCDAYSKAMDACVAEVMSGVRFPRGQREPTQVTGQAPAIG